jgi:hypothetical protein
VVGTGPPSGAEVQDSTEHPRAPTAAAALRALAAVVAAVVVEAAVVAGGGSGRGMLSERRYGANISA